MQFFIRIDEKNNPIEHPLLEENVKLLYDNFDVNNLPQGLVVFNKAEPKIPGLYEVQEQSKYVYNGSSVDEVIVIRQMTEQEKLNKQESFKQQWNAHFGYPGWIFDADNLTYLPPVPKPDDGKEYVFNVDTGQWDPV